MDSETIMQEASEDFLAQQIADAVRSADEVIGAISRKAEERRQAARERAAVS